MARETSKLETVKSVRLDAKEMDAIVERLESAPPDPGINKRDNERFSYKTHALIRIQQPGDGRPSLYRVQTRNISRGGISFLHGGFLHKGSRCVIQLNTPQGAWNDVEGKVASCRYIDKNVHEIGMRFDREIDPTLFSSNAVRLRILLVEDSPLLAKLAESFLQKLNAHHTLVENGRIAIEHALKESYDLILLDMELPEVAGFEVARTLRQKGYIGKIVATTGLTGPGDREKCLEAGCDHYIPKPYGMDDLARVIVMIGEEPVFSRFCNDPDIQPLIAEFVSCLPARLHALDEAEREQNMTRQRSILRLLKTEGASMGFDPIQSAAARVEASWVDGSDEAARSRAMLALKRECMKCRAPLCADPQVQKTRQR